MKDETEDRTLRKELNFPLSPGDFERVAKEAAGISQQLTADRLEYKQIRLEWKDKISGNETALARVLDVIQQGHEMRMVDCIERRNFSKNLIQYLVDDKVIEERAMTALERQQEMELGGGHVDGEAIECRPCSRASGTGFPVMHLPPECVDRKMMEPDFWKAAAGDDDEEGDEPLPFDEKMTGLSAKYFPKEDEHSSDDDGVGG